MHEQLEILIFHCRGRLAVLDNERSALAKEIRDYEAMLKVDPDANLRGPIIKAVERRLGNLSPTWLAILTRLASYRRFRVDDVLLEANQLNKQNDAIKRQSSTNVRFQLTKYVQKRLIERLGGGNYQVSEMCKVTLALLTAVKSPPPPSPAPTTPDVKFGPELAALAQERRVTPANPRPSRAQHERG